MQSRLLVTVFIISTVASICTAQWNWSYLSGSLESESFESTAEADSQPPPDWTANFWTTANGDIWILRNRKDSPETNMWRWDASGKQWILIGDSSKEVPVFKPPPLPDNFGLVLDPGLSIPEDPYEEAERAAIEQGINTASRQETDDGVPLPSLEPTDTSTGMQEEAVSELPEARIEASTASDTYGGRLFMFGGRGGISTKRGSHLWMFEVTSMTWTLLSGADIDYSNLCSIQESRNSPENEPCTISTSTGFDSLVYFEGKVYLVSQERERDGYHMSVWCFDVDGSRAWSYLGSSSGNEPQATSFAVFIKSYVYKNKLYIYRPLEFVGQEQAVSGEFWSFDIETKSWDIVVKPALPLERTAAWLVDGILISYMPGDVRGGVSGQRQIPAVEGWDDASNADRMVLFQLETGKYFAVQKDGTNGFELSSEQAEEFAYSNTPARRYDGVQISSGSFANGQLYLYGGSLVRKRNPDQRNDLWQCNMDFEALRSSARF